jgi:fatty acid-binding protein DegV
VAEERVENNPDLSSANGASASAAGTSAAQGAALASHTARPGFAIVCDSCSDLDPALCQRWGVSLVSYRIAFSDIELLDRSMNGDDVAEMLASNMRVHTSTPGVETFASAFEALRDEGWRDIVVVCPSSQLTGSYAAAEQAAHEVRHVRISVVDTRCVSGQLALVVARLVLDRDAGCPADEAVAHIAQTVESSQVWALLPPTVDLEGAHVLGHTHGLFRSFKSLSMRISGGWLMTTVDNVSGEVTVLRQSNDLSWLAGILARSVSVFSHKRGPLTMLEIRSSNQDSLDELRRPLDTNEFEKRVVGSLTLRPSTISVMGAGAVGVVAVAQDVLDPDSLAAMFGEVA